MASSLFKNMQKIRRAPQGAPTEPFDQITITSSGGEPLNPTVAIEKHCGFNFVRTARFTAANKQSDFHPTPSPPHKRRSATHRVLFAATDILASMSSSCAAKRDRPAHQATEGSTGWA
ncbi:hypothetical protein [Marivita cryptomonadis]|uniref:Uncharacterized protein n=1 Tax=Marivita cryptomonadis TaxID=505252 RepID=A0A9Q2NXQ2_9RHOB|nr:hypothetical protein [Marivita cryptomonadis]MCR9170510.1 hypothetical protein [Paracoccaceae bacterium]MBM2332707.1 hypothetical protein [Marivita cryptomonadis]MBM2346955.1 hypothetical protein [Marivita cryptomonadis]MBM2351632.1 hypothetical protein [Marivita cryptomonadis]MBM2366142.1 hypothetical protein [Marivita cryptomonadis]